MKDLYLEILQEFVRRPEDVEHVIMESDQPMTDFILGLLDLEEKPKTIH